MVVLPQTGVSRVGVRVGIGVVFYVMRFSWLDLSPDFSDIRDFLFAFHEFQLLGQRPLWSGFHFHNCGVLGNKIVDLDHVVVKEVTLLRLPHFKTLKHIRDASYGRYTLTQWSKHQKVKRTKIHQTGNRSWSLVLPWCCRRRSVWKGWFAPVRLSWTSCGGRRFVSSIIAIKLSGGLCADSRTLFSGSSWTLLGVSGNSCRHSCRVSGSKVFGRFSGFLDNSEWSETVLKSIWLWTQVKSCQNQDNQRGTKSEGQNNHTSKTAQHLCITWNTCRTWWTNHGHSLFFLSGFHLHFKEHIWDDLFHRNN